MCVSLMSEDSRNERERLKEEYKAHYRKMQETKERLSRIRKKKNISDALKDMDTSEMMNTFDNFLFEVKQKVATVEARLDVAMENLLFDTEDIDTEDELEEERRNESAKETLRQVKMEMGLLYNEIERQANAIKVEKTIGGRTSEGKSTESAEKESKQEQE